MVRQRHTTLSRTRAGFASRAAQTIQTAWRAYRGGRLARFQPLLRTSRYRPGMMLNAATGIAGAVAGARMLGSSSQKKTGRQVLTGGGDSKSSYTLYKPLSGALPKSAAGLPPSYVVNNSSGRDEAAVGLQSFVLIGDYFTDTDVNLGFTLLNSGATAKILLRSVKGESLITNQENVNARFTIYDVICKKDTDATVTDPLTAITTSDTDPTNGAGGDYLVPGYSPFMSPRFTEYFKVLQTTDLVLSPGACHSHTVSYAPNQYFSHALSTRIAGSGIGGLTMYTLVQYHGTPINDVTTQTQVSLSHVSMDYVQKEQYHFAYAHQGSISVDFNNALPAAFTVAGNTMQDDGVELAANEA